MSIKTLKKKILPTLKRQGVTKAAVFGSFARGEARKRSDVDLLVRLTSDKSLLDVAGLKIELEETLGRRVDIVEYSAIHPLLKKKILKEQIPIYEKRT